MSKGTLADLMKKLEAAQGVKWCAEAHEQITEVSAAEVYANAQPDYWLHTLSASNRAKCEEVVRAMMDRCTVPAGAPAYADDPDYKDFSEWYEANKKPGIGTATVALGRGALILLGKDGDGHALHINGFVKVWIAAQNDATHDPEPQVGEELGVWLRDLVPEEEFCNGYE